MKFNLLATKFHPPALPARRVNRIQILQDLQAGLAGERPLTLVSAPAGFGKTTCVCEWTASLTRPVVWLALDNSDDEPLQFLRYFIAALQKIDGTIGRELESVFSSGQIPRTDFCAAALINDIDRLAQPFLLVLDDFHIIQDRTILEILEKLIVSGQKNLHLVLITREDPPLPLGRMRANNLITEIRVSDLRFNSAETHTLLNELMELSLSSIDIARLEDRTEGWAAGLQLAGLSIRGRANPSAFISGLSGSHRFILSYLTEEVLSRQPEDIQSFLLQTSILDQLTGELCDFLTGRSDSAILLERLLSSNLFLVPLDDDQLWYRYHHLFADLLRSQQARLSREQTRQLHSRAVAWFLEAGLVSEAIRHSLAGEDYATATRLLEAHTLDLVMQGNAKTVEGWIKAVPDDWQPKTPRANLAFAWLHLVRGNYSAVLPYLQRAEIGIQQSDQHQMETTALRAEWLTLQANLLQMQGAAIECENLARQALQLIPPDNHYIRGSACLALAGALRQQGKFDQAAETYQTAIHANRSAGNSVSEILAISSFTLMSIDMGRLHFSHDLGRRAIEHFDRPGVPPPPIIGVVHAAIGSILYEWDQVSDARAHFERALVLSSFSGHNASLVNILIGIARTDLVLNNPAAAAQTARQAADTLSMAPIWLKPLVTAELVGIFLKLENIPAAEAVLGMQQSAEMDSPPPLICLALARLALHRARQDSRIEQLPAAAQMLRQSLQYAAPGVTVKLRLLLAQIQAHLGQPKESLEILEQVLHQAEPEKYLRSFLDDGPPMADLLQRCLPATTHAGYVKKLLAAFPPAAKTSAQPAGASNLVEALTEREVEVLGWMSQGLKYEEIAAKMFISVNTVRFYVKEIYGKLGVNNRTRAIEVAHQLNLFAQPRTD